MAHEMGHILLGAGHSPMGIMKPHWNEHDLRGVAWHQLLFTPDEARSLRGLGKPLIRGNDAKN